MSILLKDIHDNGTIKFTQDHYTSTMVFIGFNTVFLFFGILLETLVIASILRVRQKTVDTLFVLSLCCADLIFNLFQIIAQPLLLNARGWSTGRLGCQFSVAIIIVTLATSISSITFITLNRYLAIIWKRNITRNQALVMIGFTWISLTTIVTLYLTNKELAENSVALQSPYSYCLLDYTSRDPVVVTTLITTLCFMSLPFLFMTIAYTQIILYYRKMNRKKKKVDSKVLLYKLHRIQNSNRHTN